MTRNLIVILGDQLSHDISSLKKIDKNHDEILMMEVGDETRYVSHHPKKIILILSAMRHFAHELEENGHKVHYVKLEDKLNTDSFEREILRYYQKLKPKKILVTEPSEYRVQTNLEKLERKIPIEFLNDDRFFCSKTDFSEWAKKQSLFRMENFYRWIRKREKILIDKKGKPEGGQWNYDRDNREKFTKDLKTRRVIKFRNDNITSQVIKLVRRNFSENFGNPEPFWFGVTRKHAKKALKDFVENRLENFGRFQDVMKSDDGFLFHSVLSLYLNIGLLTPREVCKITIKKYEDGDCPINSCEGFIRQIIGWREYVRGIYWMYSPKYSDTNYLNAKGALPDFFWTGDTKLNCLKKCIIQTKDESYAHHIQRLMVTGNFSLISGINPKQICEWYLSVYSDAFEWVELPNTHGMSQFADGGKLGSKPYAASGAYINKMSDYCKSCHYSVKEKTGSSACPFNYLYWDFFIRNKSKLQSNPRLWTVYANIKKMNPNKIKQIRNDSKAFLSENKII
ncbi:cryptochrome/photolyase family protein [Nitrosopumilus sp. b1]|uniref:cryptochrome/photolyase family protein n=1 Tax=Nitrosopumilus sp. b1 TaxID=2109907 RepID=UPI0015F42E58|nr:cryptochrome/photolyase family protein [Nitrosopumilus sp. b1]KAF6242197.1 cryptochrome/photolyase family protein [Nitrosopumilus sp. b1]